MKRSEFEKYLGNYVEVRLFDGDIIKGVLRKTKDEIFKNDPDLYLKKNYYFVTDSRESRICTSTLFRVSHVTKIKKTEKGGTGR